MKKLLLGLLIALVVMVLLVFALNGCDDVPTAHAILHNISYNGVVHPNLLSVNDFKSPSFVPISNINSVDTSLPDGLYFSDLFSISSSSTDSDLNLANNNALKTTFVSSPSSKPCFYVLFTFPSFTSSSVFLSLNIGSIDGSTAYVRLMNLDSGIDYFNSNNSLFNGSGMNLAHWGSPDYTSNWIATSSLAGSRCLLYYEPIASYSSITFTGIKLEAFSSYGGNYPYFTGFVLPGYTFTDSGISPDPSPDPLAGWSGFVNYNIIENPDFFNYPVLRENYSNVTQAEQNIWITNQQGLSFSYNGPDDLGYLDCSRLSEYGQNRVLPFFYYYSTFPDRDFLIGTTLHFRVMLNSDVGGSVILTSGGGSESAIFDAVPVGDGFNFVDVTIPSTKVSTFLAILIQFDDASDASNLYGARLYYSKLEVGSLFTGYVPFDHSWSYEVQDNLLNNYNFRTVPLNDPTMDAWWTTEPMTFAHITSDDTGLLWDTTGIWRDDVYFTYNFSDFTTYDPTQSFCFSMQMFLQSNSPEYYRSYCLFEAFDPDLEVYYRTIFSESFSPSDYSFTFPQSRKLRISLYFPDQVYTCRIYYAKLEPSNFTGYCPNFQENYDLGYSQGYDAGYIVGTDTYGQSRYNLNFNDDQQPDYLSFGWSDMGFNDDETMFAANMVISSVGYYTFKGYYISSTATVDFPDSQDPDLSYRVLYASPDPNFLASNPSLSLSYVKVVIYKTYMTSLFVDPAFPVDYTSIAYPSYKEVNIDVQRGLSGVLEGYGNSKFEEGRVRGFYQGYDQGKQDGIAVGINQAQDYYATTSGGWFSFVSAFIDVPIKTITNLLDFDFFGFNLLNLVKIFLVFSLTYMVIRLITKGKVAQ